MTTSTLLETYPFLWQCASLKCLWRSPAWWGTALPVYCPEVYQAANHKKKIVKGTTEVINWISENIFFRFKANSTFKFFSRWQQVHSTSFICLSQEMVRSLERAKETYQALKDTFENNHLDKNHIWKRFDVWKVWDIYKLTFGSFSASMLARIARQSFSNLCVM